MTANTLASGATLADGRLLSTANWGALFALLGNQFGGNGTTAFALPDLRDAAPNGLAYVICTEGVFPPIDRPRYGSGR